MKPYAASKAWTFESLRSGYERTQPLALAWEVNGDPYSDDYIPAEISADELWHQWLRYIDSGDLWDKRLGRGWLSIYWSIRGVGVNPVFETAPFQLPPWDKVRHFLAYFTWPVDADGEPVNWLRLPVIDKLWDDGYSDKGGFIQSATGWKPGPYQPSVYLPTLQCGSAV